MNSYSLRRRRLGAFLRPLLAAATSAPAISRLRDQQMQQTADLLLTLMRHDALEGDTAGRLEPLVQSLEHPAPEFQVRSPDADIAPGLVFRGNPDAVGIVVGNLFDIATKFTPATGSIALKAGADAMEVCA